MSRFDYDNDMNNILHIVRTPYPWYHMSMFSFMYMFNLLKMFYLRMTGDIGQTHLFKYLKCAFNFIDIVIVCLKCFYGRN